MLKRTESRQSVCRKRALWSKTHIQHTIDITEAMTTTNTQKPQQQQQKSNKTTRERKTTKKHKKRKKSNSRNNTKREHKIYMNRAHAIYSLCQLHYRPLGLLCDSIFWLLLFYVSLAISFGAFLVYWTRNT